MGKQSAYEHSVRVPLLLSGPGVTKRGVSETPCYLFDIYPTLCDLLHVEIPAGVEGKSLVADLEQNVLHQNTRKTLYFAYADLLRGIKKDGYKLIEYASSKGRYTQLFNLIDDPWETLNLADFKEFEKIVDSMKNELLKERDIWEDNYLEVSNSFWNNYSIV